MKRRIMSTPLDINCYSMSTYIDMNIRRSYDMTGRAEAAAATRQRILQSTLDLALEKIAMEITLDDIATRAGVTVKTVLRHFGSRDGLFAELEEFATAQIRRERAAPAGDVVAAVHATFDHYERLGDAVLRLLGQELFDDKLRESMDGGRRLHREQIAQVFAPQLAAHPAADRDALLDLLVVATDVYTWKLLRRDRGLDRPTAEERVRQLIAGLLAD